MIFTFFSIPVNAAELRDKAVLHELCQIVSMPYFRSFI